MNSTNAMADKFFVDTNILVYAYDRSSGRKHQKAKTVVEELWRSAGGVVSTQVLQELAANLRRKCTPPLGTDDTRQLIQDYLAWEVVVNGPESTLQALDLESRYKISFWDALVLHAAETAGAATLYSEDLSHRQRYGSVQVLNPFK